jgi:hypothetical protein
VGMAGCWAKVPTHAIRINPIRLIWALRNMRDSFTLRRGDNVP